MTTRSLLLTFGALVLVLIQVQSLYLPLAKRGNSAIENKVTDPKKRPFCNAFTGCGRKRSNLPALQSDDESIEDESIGTLFELSAEPAVEDLSRQIMSEAKLWEAIREANKELARHRQQFREGANEEDTGVRNGASSCAMPPCII